ncbi:methionine--tRNA ligase [Nanobdella aerobiophila]|uniref:Methionine--tRNA ligase n=1 Tax=Nanobdella aerobiophila TaxID=2586965 RepID=A0A915WRY9_9ARCH|nr:methionine--tRNA ligase subunit beta [Nanobdella aerobiophila]BBL45774.1 methionine--tRNA ligase [Nanobdella aerobiophila]
MDSITIEDLQKIRLIVGKILEVQDHPNADKLYVLKVDIGGEIRTIVSGIKSWYKKEELINKKIIIVTNLQYKNFRGIESQGMLLAAEYDNFVSLLTVDKDIKEGSIVH